MSDKPEKQMYMEIYIDGNKFTSTNASENTILKRKEYILRVNDNMVYLEIKLDDGSTMVMLNSTIKKAIFVFKERKESDNAC